MENKESYKEEQIILDYTIKQIENQSYYIWEQVEKKTAQFKNKISSPGDDIALRNGKKEMSILKSALAHPYFGRMDVHTDEFGEETFYIGKQGVKDKEENAVVLDWRMPMASVYYNFSPGNPRQKYTSFNEETFEIEVTRKREFTIKNKKIIRMIQQMAELNSKLNKTYTEKGEEITVTDDFLREIIENSETNGFLKEIIATIQQEQNTAIRQPISKNLIVQGVAGSGKSSIALHRLSYLLFNNNKLKPEDVLILGPSDLFMSSFKDMLPNLDLNGINQSTFQKFALTYLDGYLGGEIIGSAWEFFEKVLFPNNREKEQIQIEFKGSVEMTSLIDTFLEAYKTNYIEKIRSFALWGHRLEVEDLQNIFAGYAYLPFSERVDKFVEYVNSFCQKRLNEKIHDLRDTYESITGKYMKQAGLTEKSYQSLSVKMKEIFNYKRRKLEQEYKEAINDFKETYKVPKLLTLYKQILSNDVVSAFLHEDCKEVINAFRDYSLKDVTYFDLPPLLYLYFSFYGESEKFSHLVIDEAQDFSFMHFAVLQKVTKTMTLLGDIDQSIYLGYGQQNWNKIRKLFFYGKEDQLLNMGTSYRSTMQVIEAANKVLSNQFPDHMAITAINRSGPAVSVEEVKNGVELVQSITSTIGTWTEKYKKIAIVHKDERKAEKLAEYLTKELKKEVKYIRPEDETMSGQISVLASYNSKGMEFDAVLLVNVNEESFPKDDLHARLLYVLLTRAQKEVKVFYQDKPSILLDGLVKADVKVTTSKFDDIL